MNSIALQVGSLLQQEGDPTVRIEGFTGPASSTAGPRLTESLRRHLTKQRKIELVSIGSSYSISGRFSVDPKDHIMVISATVHGPLGDLQTVQDRFKTTPEEMAALLNVSTDLTDTLGPTQTPAEEAALATRQEDEILEKLSNPQVTAQPTESSPAKTVIKPSADFPYGVEIALRDGENYSALAVDDQTLTRGYAAVDIPAEQNFAVRILNNTTDFVGVAITFDGINIFAFSENEDYRKLGRMAIRPLSSPYIKGWHHAGNDSFSFIVTNYGESAAAELGSTSDLGAMTVVFYECETPTLTRGSKSVNNDVGIGRGERVNANYQNVPVRFGKMLGSVSVFYNRPSHPVDLPQ